MTANNQFEHVTTNAAVKVYESSKPIFEGVLGEVRELSRKKPDAIMSSGKVKIINRILDDLLSILGNEPEGKYLEILNDEALPQVSDAVLTMVQFETSLAAFKGRYYRYVEGVRYWITSELLAAWKKRR